jgi:hypothetical protein
MGKTARNEMLKLDPMFYNNVAVGSIIAGLVIPGSKFLRTPRSDQNIYSRNTRHKNLSAFTAYHSRVTHCFTRALARANDGGKNSRLTGYHKVPKAKKYHRYTYSAYCEHNDHAWSASTPTGFCCGFNDWLGCPNFQKAEIKTSRSIVHRKQRSTSRLNTSIVFCVINPSRDTIANLSAKYINL